MTTSSTADTVGALIDRRAASNGERVFVYCADGSKDLSFAALRAEALRIDRLLRQRDIRPGATVAFLLDNGYYTTCLFLGLMYGGRIALPLNAVAGADVLEYVIDHAETPIIFVSQRYHEEYGNLFRRLENRIEIIVCDENNGPESLSATTSDRELNEAITPSNPDQTAILIYTSGTTGRPKGVLLSHRNVLAGGRNTAQAHRLTSQDRGLCVLPLYHINAEMVSLMAPLISNGSVVMPRRLSISRFWRWVVDYGCTWFSVVPTIVSYLIEHRQSHAHAVDLKAVQRLIRFGRSASAALPEATHQKFETLFGIPIVETMGISEAAAQILSNPLPPQTRKLGSPGRAVGNEVRIVTEKNELAATGEKGEIVVRGDNIMLGYLRNPTETAKAIDKQGWLHTGDLGFMDPDGFVFVTGRMKELIIKGGENIAPREIDDVLYRHTDILEAAAFGIPDHSYGQEVAAYVVLRQNAECTVESLVEHCVAHLGEYKAPRRIRFSESLPKGPSGKIQRLKAAELFITTEGG